MFPIVYNTCSYLCIYPFVCSLSFPTKTWFILKTDSAHFTQWVSSPKSVFACWINKTISYDKKNESKWRTASARMNTDSKYFSAHWGSLQPHRDPLFLKCALLNCNWLYYYELVEVNVQCMKHVFNAISLIIWILGSWMLTCLFGFTIPTSMKLLTYL